MYLPPLQPNRNPNIYMSGDVTIDERAAIASGVILQASPGTRIVIAAGVCIGMGSILQACQGNLIIEEGAALGASVLAIGTGKIGANSCIGSASTLINPAVASNEVIPPGSVLGDESRQWVDVETTAVDPGPEAPSGPIPIAPDPPKPPEPVTGYQPPPVVGYQPPPVTGYQPPPVVGYQPPPVTGYQPPPVTGYQPPPVAPEPAQPIPSNGATTAAEPAPLGEPAVAASPASVYGQAHLNRLMLTLFPHKQTPIQPTPED